jgi:hypothetical protein
MRGIGKIGMRFWNFDEEKKYCVAFHANKLSAAFIGLALAYFPDYFQYR